MIELDGHIFYDYVSAGRRVKRSPRTIKRWRRDLGMETVLVNGHRLIREDHLLAAFRHSLKNSPVHQHRLRAIARGQGVGSEIAPPVKRSEPIHCPPDPNPPQSTQEPFQAVHGAHSQPENTIPGLTRGADEYAALQNALRTTEPACAGIDAYGRCQPWWVR